MERVEREISRKYSRRRVLADCPVWWRTAALWAGREQRGRRKIFSRSVLFRALSGRHLRRERRRVG